MKKIKNKKLYIYILYYIILFYFLEFWFPLIICNMFDQLMMCLKFRQYFFFNEKNPHNLLQEISTILKVQNYYATNFTNHKFHMQQINNEKHVKFVHS
jgi:hypothetical protein